MRSLLALLAFMLCLFVSAAEIVGRCVRVSDGDTIIVDELCGNKFKVRLAAIDAPEKDQPYGQEAKAKLTEMLLGQIVLVQFKAVDRYARILGTVIVDTRGDAAKEMLKSGLAWHYSYFDKNEENAALEQEARSAKRGLWQDKCPVPPWEYRKNKKETKHAK